MSEEKPAGSYEVEFNVQCVAGGLPSGVYFYQLTAGNFLGTKKMRQIWLSILSYKDKHTKILTKIILVPK